MDFETRLRPDDIFFAMDALKNVDLGFGGHCQKSWMQASWGEFIHKNNPSIQYLELFALVAGVLAWIHRFPNKMVILYTDNKNVKSIVNRTSSGCKNCMVLVRLLVIHCLRYNVRVFAEYLTSKSNEIADSLSRFQERKFARLRRKFDMDRNQTEVPSQIWPVEKIWIE